MSRHSTDFLELEHQVGRLLEAMETAYVRARRANEGGLVFDAGPQKETFCAALSAALGHVSAESVRQDFHKYRLGRAAKGGRVPSVEKVVRLTDAASKLGWIDPLATGSGAEPLVAWCRREMARVKHVASERAAKKDATRRALAVTDAERDIDFALSGLPPERIKAVATEMLAVMTKRVQQHLLRQELSRQPDGGFLHDDVAQTNVDLGIREILMALEDEIRLWIGPEGRAQTGLVASVEAVREMVEMNLPRNRAVLEADALKLGIGSDQLKLILASFYSGAGLEPEDAIWRDELLAGYCGFRRAIELVKDRSLDHRAGGSSPRAGEPSSAHSLPGDTTKVGTR